MNKLRRTFTSAILAGLAIFTVGTANAVPGKDFSYYSGQRSEPVDHSAWGNFLGHHVKTAPDGINRIDYGAVPEEDHLALKAYIAALASMDPAELKPDAGFAYWVNLYNAVTVDIVLDNYPVSSIRKIRSGLYAGPWRRKLVTVKGEALSLDDIEHGILREHWKDPRVHYAVNCASLGCPNLSPVPWTAATLDAQLEAAARAYINHPRGVTTSDNGRLTVSTIYRWFQKDFGDGESDVIRHLMRYADDPLREKLAAASGISGYEYNWSLNDAAEQK